MFWSLWPEYRTFISENKIVSKLVPKISRREENQYILKNIYQCEAASENYTASSQICMVASESMSRATDGEFQTLELANVNIHVNFRPYLPKNLTFLCLEREILTNTQNQVHICVFSKIQIKFRPQTRQEWYCKQFVMFFMVSKPNLSSCNATEMPRKNIFLE